MLWSECLDVLVKALAPVARSPYASMSINYQSVDGLLNELSMMHLQPKRPTNFNI